MAPFGRKSSRSCDAIDCNHPGQIVVMLPRHLGKRQLPLVLCACCYETIEIYLPTLPTRSPFRSRARLLDIANLWVINRARLDPEVFDDEIDQAGWLTDAEIAEKIRERAASLKRKRDLN